MKHDSRLYLCAPVNAIVEGIYEEHIPFSEIKRHGDFGLGTFDMLDGEMVMLDGRVYQMTADGRVQQVGDDALTPFACVTFYQPEQVFDLDGELDHDAFLRRLLEPLPSPNIFYAFRIEGEFAYVKARSVPKSECYIPLVEIAREQPIFEFENIRGTLAGFYTPLLDQFDRAVSEGFIRPANRQLVVAASEADELLDLLSKPLPRAEPKWIDSVSDT